MTWIEYHWHVSARVMRLSSQGYLELFSGIPECLGVPEIPEFVGVPESEIWFPGTGLGISQALCTIWCKLAHVHSKCHEITTCKDSRLENGGL